MEKRRDKVLSTWFREKKWTGDVKMIELDARVGSGAWSQGHSVPKTELQRVYLGVAVCPLKIPEYTFLRFRSIWKREEEIKNRKKKNKNSNPRNTGEREDLGTPQGKDTKTNISVSWISFFYDCNRFNGRMDHDFLVMQFCTFLSHYKERHSNRNEELG